MRDFFSNLSFNIEFLSKLFPICPKCFHSVLITALGGRLSENSDLMA